jgi:hypothetical protein
MGWMSEANVTVCCAAGLAGVWAFKSAPTEATVKEAKITDGTARRIDLLAFIVFPPK